MTKLHCGTIMPNLGMAGVSKACTCVCTVASFGVLWSNLEEGVTTN